MKTLIVIAIEHPKEIPALGEMIAGRAYTISGVEDATFVKDFDSLPVISPEGLEAMGFTLEEISLGSQDVERG